MAKINFKGERGYFAVYRNGAHVADINGSGGEFWINGTGEGRPFLARLKYSKIADAKRWAKVVLSRIDVATVVRSIDRRAEGSIFPGDLERFFDQGGKWARKRKPTEEDLWMAEIRTVLEWDAAERRYKNHETIYPDWKPRSHMTAAEIAPIIAEEILQSERINQEWETLNPGQMTFVCLPRQLTSPEGKVVLDAEVEKLRTVLYLSTLL